MSGLAPPSASDSASLYGRHRVGLPPPPAHQGYGTHGVAFGAGPSPLQMAVPSAFGDFSSAGHPHHPLAEHAQSSALYQQLLQQHRQQQEELLLRNSTHPHPHPSMMLHQNLLGSPAAYPPGFTPGLGLQQPFQGWL